MADLLQPNTVPKDMLLVLGVLECVGGGESDTNVEHMATLLNSFKIFTERNAVRGDTWKSAGVNMMMNLAKSKLERLAYAVGEWRASAVDKSELSTAAYDDALDLVNYAAFIARHIEENWNG